MDFMELRIVAIMLRFENWEKCRSDFVCTISQMERYHHFFFNI